MRRVKTVCIYCGVGCGIEVYVEKDEILRVAPLKNHPVSDGKLCRKGWKCYEFVTREDRLTTPLVRTNGRFKTTSWRKAISLVASNFRRIQRKHGKDALAFISSAKATNEENYLFQKLARTLGTNNIDHVARLCHSSTVEGLIRAFGSGAMSNPISDIEKSRCMMVVGSNTTEQHPLIATRIIRRKEDGGKLIVIDPRKTQIAAHADIHLQHPPGTDLYLLNSLAHVILEEGLEDRDFIEKRTEGFEDFSREMLREKYDPDNVEKILKVEAESIREAAILYANMSPASIYYAMGITQHVHGTDNVLALANLALLTGNVGKRGAGVNPLRGHQNVQGACDMGVLPNVLPGYRPLESPLNERGLTVMEMFWGASKGKIRGMYIMGANPCLSNPDASRAAEALKSLDFLVVQDIFMTETARLADVVLPASSWLEKEGTFTSTERRVQRIHRALKPRGRPDWKILVDLGRALGFKEEFSYNSPEDIFAEIAREVPQYRGMSYEALEGEGLFWPYVNGVGIEVLFVDKFPKGKGAFHPVRAAPPAENPDEKYDLTLTTGRVTFHFHTGSMTRRSPSLEGEVPEGFVEMHRADAMERGIKNGDVVRVLTRRGSIVLKAKLVDTIKRGTLFIPFHFAEAEANILTIPALDEAAKIPEFKVCACRVEPVI